MQDGKVMLVKRTSTAYYTTGALLYNTVAKPVSGQIPLRILNATNEELTLWKGTVIGKAEPLYTCNQFKAEALESVEYGCVCKGEGEWKRTCTELEQEMSVIELMS